MMAWIGSHLLTLLLLFPLAGGVANMLIPGERKLALRLVSLVSALGTLAVSVALLVAYPHAPHLPGQTMRLQEQVDWIPFSGVTYHLGVDGISLVLVLLTALIITTGVFASWRVEHRTKEFLALLLLLVTGVFGVFIALDLFFFFLFYEIAVLPMYLLIGIWGTGPREYAALKLTLFLLVGSAFMLVGILGLYWYSGLPTRTFDLVALGQAGPYPPGLQVALFLLLYLGFGILAGIWPLHTWSPDGHASAPTAVSMLHAGVLMKLGAYGILRVGVALLPQGAQYWAFLVGTVAVINIVYGALSAMGQRDLKYVIAYSSVSHMGVVMLGIAALNGLALNGSVMQMFSHGIMTGLFFALVGLVYEKSHTRDIPSMGGFARYMPGIAVAFVLAGLSSLGLPGTAGFAAEVLVFLGAFRAMPLLAAISLIGIVITAAYVLRVVQKIFMGKFDPKYEGIPDARTTEWVALAVLGAVLLIVGAWPGPMVHLIESGLRPILGVLGVM